uniref:Alpha-macroglobulin receptor-binding domain-containing protein n=1 Tax=Podarcis muralis TaxID=64176 RepID=A0A670KBZ7_PODMU
LTLLSAITTEGLSTLLLALRLESTVPSGQVFLTLCPATCFFLFQDPVVKNGLDYLKTTVSDTTDIYVQGLLAYVFTLAGDVAMRQMLLTKLDQQAIKSGTEENMIPRTAPASTENPWSQPESVSVELTAYVLMARLSPQNVSKEDIKKATDIVAWLAKQQNAYGGFASTQDTVVALQALAKYGAVTYTRSEDLLITVKSDKTFQQSFHLDDTNRLVLQQATLPDIPGEYTMQASGKGCGYVQVSDVLRYNIPPSKNEDTFTLDVKACPRSQQCHGEVGGWDLKWLMCNSSSSLDSYVGSRGTSNMAMIEVKMLSGFHPLMQQPLVKRVEIGEEHLTIYLDQVRKERQTYTLAMSQDIPVKDLKPAAVKVYDYYQPGRFFLMLKNSNIFNSLCFSQVCAACDLSSQIKPTIYVLWPSGVL